MAVAAMAGAAEARDLELALFGLRSNRFTVQPLRLDVTNLSPRSSSLYRAQSNFHTPLAVPTGGSGGGPLIPVYERQFQSDVYAEEADPEKPPPEPMPEGPWTLYSSIWGYATGCECARDACQARGRALAAKAGGGQMGRAKAQRWPPRADAAA